MRSEYQLLTGAIGALVINRDGKIVSKAAHKVAKKKNKVRSVV